MRWLVLLLAIPVAAAEPFVVDDPEDDVTEPYVALQQYDIVELGLEAENGTVHWYVGFARGVENWDFVGGQTDWVVRLHWIQNGTEHVIEHQETCLSLQVACAGGTVPDDECRWQVWAESVWRRPDGPVQMDRVPDEGMAVWDRCATMDATHGTPDPRPAVTTGPPAEETTPAPGPIPAIVLAATKVRLSQAHRPG